jgi:hypothetical protein
LKSPAQYFEGRQEFHDSGAHCYIMDLALEGTGVLAKSALLRGWRGSLVSALLRNVFADHEAKQLRHFQEVYAPDWWLST